MPQIQTPTYGSDVPRLKVIAFDGAAAGVQTVVGAKVGDLVMDVIAWPDAGGAPSNVGSEFVARVTTADQLDNTGGTSLAAKVGVAYLWPMPTQLK